MAIPGGVGIQEGVDEGGWIVANEKHKYDEIFQTLEQSNGKVTGMSPRHLGSASCLTPTPGRAAKEHMMQCHLPNKVLGRIWGLADTDGDGMLDVEEFALAMHLIKVALTSCSCYRLLLPGEGGGPRHP